MPSSSAQSISAVRSREARRGAVQSASVPGVEALAQGLEQGQGLDLGVDFLAIRTRLRAKDRAAVPPDG